MKAEEKRKYGALSAIVGVILGLASFVMSDGYVSGLGFLGSVSNMYVVVSKGEWVTARYSVQPPKNLTFEQALQWHEKYLIEPAHMRGEAKIPMRLALLVSLILIGGGIAIVVTSNQS